LHNRQIYPILHSETMNTDPLKPLERLILAQTARPLDVVAYWRNEGHLELSPPYQRGDVWGLIRRRNLIRSILLGIPIPSIIVNDRFAANWGEEIAVIDGKQRITTILMFLDGEIAVPGQWFGMSDASIRYCDLTLPMQRRLRGTPIPFCEGKLGSIDAEAEVFELVNFGGVPQGQTDLPTEP
jgi:hypothetical protein